MLKRQQDSVSVSSASEHSTFRVIIGLGTIALLFFYAVKELTDVLTDVDESRYELIANRFDRSMNYVHQHWMFNGKPKRMILPYLVESNVEYPLQVVVSRQGWPINVADDADELNCLALWMYFAHDVNQASGILNLTENLQVQTESESCIYLDGKDEQMVVMFRYEPIIGKVTAL